MMGLRLLYWNVRDLATKMAYLRQVVKTQNIDIALINETHCGPRDTWIEVEVAGKPLAIYSIYYPPTDSYCSADVKTILDAGEAVLTAGDWNAKDPHWNATKTSPRGTQLLHDADALAFEVIGPDVPTHYPDQTAWVPDTIDLVVYRGFPGRIALDVLVDEFLSDHQPVVAELSDSTPSTTPTQPRRTIDWSVFQTAPSLPTPSNAQEIDDTAVKLTSLIQNALTAATTSENPKIIEDRLPGRLMKLIAEKRTLRRQWQASRCPRQKADLNRLALKVRRALEDHAKTSWETIVDDATTDWVRLHRLCRSLNGQRDPVRPLKHHDGSYIYSASSRAELFADHLETQFQPNPAKDPVRARRIETAAEHLMRQRIPAEEAPIYISPSTVFRAARSLKARKAPRARRHPKPSPATPIQKDACLVGTPIYRHRTPHALPRILEVTAVFLDMEKAFDRVWHAGLLEKVKTLELPRRLRALICSYLRSRSFFVSVEDARSSQRPIAAAMYTETRRFVIRRADSVKQLGTAVLDSRVTAVTATALDRALTTADKYVDKYLPPDQQDASDVTSAESVESGDGSGRARAEQALQHGARFGRKLQRRLTRQALAEAKAIKEQIHVLVYVAELVAKDPALAWKKAKELYASLSKSEPENQARPATLEELVVLLARETARKVVHLINYTHSDLPKNVRQGLSVVTTHLSAAADALLKKTLVENAITEVKSWSTKLTTLLQQLQDSSKSYLEHLAMFLAGNEEREKITPRSVFQQRDDLAAFNGVN
ncbi:unnamed protein product [Pieris brassicae]|uniref:Endonuclease/exonuclease/phosphatase domain-containing protein n=1 Tax=Pieris brassicae TaxID=7116 RepID=A0A9P0X022_PIEBR|nr:unnamed protein product [Pieris brassicae]